MAKQPESRLQRNIRDRLEREVGGWWFKVWGGPLTPAGIPDLVGCVQGLFFALEVKMPRRSSQPSPIQIAMMRRIEKAGGHVAVVRSTNDAVEFVQECLSSGNSKK